MNIISGSSNPELASSIVKILNQKCPTCKSTLIGIDISKFANNEKRVLVKDEAKVRGQKICIVQSFSNPVDENIIETLLITDALKRLGAKEVSIIIPWMGYSLQDKIFLEGEAIAAKVIADLISDSFISRVFLLDLHNPSIPGFFSIPTYHLSAESIFVDYLKKKNYLDNTVVVSPDFGGLKRARSIADLLDLPLLNIDKTRNSRTGVVTAHALHGGEIKGKNAILFDDVIVSGSTVIETATLLKKEGAEKITFIATHGIFCNNGIEAIDRSPVDVVITSDSIKNATISKKIERVHLAPLFVAGPLDWIKV
jgi:ribose-phosphate pyrophosphokinase